MWQPDASKCMMSSRQLPLTSASWLETHTGVCLCPTKMAIHPKSCPGTVASCTIMLYKLEGKLTCECLVPWDCCQSA